MTLLDDEERPHLGQVQIHGITCAAPVELSVAGRRGRLRQLR
jgi:hypothetical protein